MNDQLFSSMNPLLKFGQFQIKLIVVVLQFVDPGTEWAHLDIAGPVWNRKTGTATGYPVRTLVKWIDQQQIVAGIAGS